MSGPKAGDCPVTRELKQTLTETAMKMPQNMLNEQNGYTCAALYNFCKLVATSAGQQCEITKFYTFWIAYQYLVCARF